MTTKDLEQLNSLCKEILYLEQRLEHLNLALLMSSGDAEYCTVKGSSPNFPYILHSITVCSPGGKSKKSAIHEDIVKVRTKIREKNHELVKEYERLNTWILNLDNSEIRHLLSLRYIDGYTWQQIAFIINKELGTAHDESYPRQKCGNYLKATEITEIEMI